MSDCKQSEEGGPTDEMWTVSNAIAGDDSDLENSIAWALLSAITNFPEITIKSIALLNGDDSNQYQMFCQELVNSMLSKVSQKSKNIFNFNDEFSEDNKIAQKLSSAILAASTNFPKLSQKLYEILSEDTNAEYRKFCQNLLSSIFSGYSGYFEDNDAESEINTYNLDIPYYKTCYSQINNVTGDNALLNETLNEVVDLGFKLYPVLFRLLGNFMAPEFNASENQRFCYQIIQFIIKDCQIDVSLEKRHELNVNMLNKDVSKFCFETLEKLEIEFSSQTAYLQKILFSNNEQKNTEQPALLNFAMFLIISIKKFYFMTKKFAKKPKILNKPSKVMFKLSKALAENKSIEEKLAQAIHLTSKKFPKLIHCLTAYFLQITSDPSNNYVLFAKMLIKLLNMEVDLESNEQFYLISKELCKNQNNVWNLAGILFRLSKDFPDVTKFSVFMLKEDILSYMHKQLFREFFYNFSNLCSNEKLKNISKTKVFLPPFAETYGNAQSDINKKISDNSEETNPKGSLRKKAKEEKSVSEEFSNLHFTPERIDVTKKLHFFKFIGVGGDGKVNAYKDITNGKFYAIKEIGCPPMSRDKIRPFLKQNLHFYSREASILSQLDSTGLFTKCIQTFISYDETWQQNESDVCTFHFCIQMPLYEMTIDQLSAKLRTLSCSYLALWFNSVLMQEVIEAVEIMHENQLVHRDIKPGNILISLQGTQSMVRLGDFGFVRPMNVTALTPEELESMEQSNKTPNPNAHLLSNECCGTPYYRAPNVLEKGVYTPKDDIYSLGMLYCELLKLILFDEMSEITPDELIKTLIKTKHDTFRLAILLHKAIQQEPENRPTVKDVKEMNRSICGIIKDTETFFNQKFDKKLNSSKLEDFVDLFLHNVFENQNKVLLDYYKKMFFRSNGTFWPHLKIIDEHFDEIFKE